TRCHRVDHCRGRLAAAIRLGGSIRHAVIGEVIAYELADDLRGGEVLAGAQLLERLFLLGVDEYGEPGGFSFHGNRFFFESTSIVRKLGRDDSVSCRLEPRLGHWRRRSHCAQSGRTATESASAKAYRKRSCRPGG